MYTIISDVRAYPDFLNWCRGVEIVSEAENEMVARMLVSFSKLNLGFTTRNELRENESLTMTLVEGPFSKLNGQWTLHELNESASKISLEMDFDFESAITQKLFGRVFQNVVAAQLDAFQARASALYKND